MGFIEDFCHYSSENECPVPFLEWSAVTLLAAVAGRKLWTMHGAFEIDPRLYTCLVGTPGSGKSTAMLQAEKLFIRLFPDYLVSESIQSREDLLNKMTSEQCEHVKKVEHEGRGRDIGSYIQWRPFFCLVDEMENFVSVDEKKMVATLVGLYGRDSFGTGFKNDPNKNQRIVYPYLTLLACTIPEWMMSSLRESLFVGGLGRRLIIVHAIKTREVPNPGLPLDAAETMTRMETHLRTLEKHYGFIRKSPEAQAWWDTWYMSKGRKNREDPILMQFHETAHIQVLKVAMLFAVSDNPEALEITDVHLKKAVVALKRLEQDIVRLTSGIGRNELAGVGAQVLNFIERAGGAVTRVTLLRTFGRYFKLREFNEQFDLYLQSEQLYQITNKEGQIAYVTPEYRAALLRASPPPDPLT